MARVIRALRAESFPMDISNIDYAVGDFEVEDGMGSYIPVRDLTDFLMEDTYEEPEALIDDLQKIARGAKVIEMPKTKRLADRGCVPCQKGTPALDSPQAQKFLGELGSGWSFTDDGRLHKIFRFKDFMGPMDFANRIAKLSEHEGHHPDLHISWGMRHRALDSLDQRLVRERLRSGPQDRKLLLQERRSACIGAVEEIVELVEELLEPELPSPVQASRPHSPERFPRSVSAIGAEPADSCRQARRPR